MNAGLIDVKSDDLFAFWRYDLFPYMLGAKVDKSATTEAGHLKGCVYVQSYSGWVRPFAILTGTAGLSLMLDLRRMEDEHREAMAAIYERSRVALVERLAACGVTHPSENIRYSRAEVGALEDARKTMRAGGVGS